LVVERVETMASQRAGDWAESSVSKSAVWKAAKWAAQTAAELVAT
jgi:hypothetical protein